MHIITITRVSLHVILVRGWRVSWCCINPMFFVPLFSFFFRIIKTLASYTMSHSYLSGVTAAEPRRHLENINAIQSIPTNLNNNLSRNETLMNGHLVNIASVRDESAMYWIYFNELSPYYSGAEGTSPHTFFNYVKNFWRVWKNIM